MVPLPLQTVYFICAHMIMNDLMHTEIASTYMLCNFFHSQISITIPKQYFVYFSLCYTIPNWYYMPLFNGR